MTRARASLAHITRLIAWYESNIVTARRTLASRPSPLVARACLSTIAHSSAMIEHVSRRNA